MEAIGTGGEIRTRIILEDEMSGTLEAVYKKVENVINVIRQFSELDDALGSIGGSVNDISGSLEKFKQNFTGIAESIQATQKQTESFKNVFDGLDDNLENVAYAFDSIGCRAEDAVDQVEMLRDRMYSAKVATDYLNESQKALKALNIEIGESTEDIKEAIVEKVEVIQEKKEAIEEVGEAVAKTTQKVNNNARGVNQLAQGIARLGSNLGVVPKQFSMMVSGVVQFNNGLRQTVPLATKITTLLAPMTLIATSIMAILSIIRHFRQDIEEVIEPFESLIGRAERLKGKSNQLERSLAENVSLLERMNEIGASQSIVDWLEGNIQLTQTWANALRGIGLAEMQAGVNQLMEQLTYQEQIIERTLDAEATRRARQSIWITEHVGYTDDIVAQLVNAVNDSGEWADLKGLYFHFDDEDIGAQELIKQFMEYADVLRNSADPAAREMATRLDELTEATASLTAVYIENYELMNRDKKGREERIAQLLQETEATQRLQQAYASMANRITRMFRDTYDAAYRTAEAHYAVAGALETMARGYDVTIEQFDSIMSMAPEMLNFLFDEYGALKDVEDAVYLATQAYMELQMERQINMLLDSVTVWDAEGNVIGMVEGRVYDLAAAYRETTNARLAMFATAGADQGEIARLDEMIAQIRNIGESGQRTAAARGMGMVSGAAGTRSNPVHVRDVDTEGFRGEMIQLWRDINETRYIQGAYQQRNIQVPPVSIDMSGIQVYAPEGVNAKQVAEIVKQTAGYHVAQELQGAFRQTMRRFAR